MIIPLKGDWIEIEETTITRKRRLFMGFDENTGDIITMKPAFHKENDYRNAKQVYDKNKGNVKTYSYPIHNHKISCIIEYNPDSNDALQ